MGALSSRFAMSLMTQRVIFPKRASLHTGTPPTEANRITEAGYVYEAARGSPGTSFWQVWDTTAGLAIGSDAATRLYAEVDFTTSGANPPAPADGTRIRAVGIAYARRALESGEDQADLPYDYLAWSTLDQPWPAASKLLRFLQPGNANRDDDFPAPYLSQPAVSLAGRGGQWTDHSQPVGGGFGLFATSFFRLFVARPTAGQFNERRAARNNCDLVFSDSPSGAPHVDWPLVPFGLVSRFFLHGGTTEEDALDLINIGKIVVPSAAADRTLPKYYQIRLASTGGRGVQGSLQGKHIFWGMLGRCRSVVDSPDPGRAVQAGQSLKIPSGALCVPLWPRYDSDDPYYFSPEPAAPLDLKVDASKPGEVVLTWDVVRDAKGYVVQLSDDLSFGSVDSECVVFRPTETFYNLPSRPWIARVRATNAGGGSPWSDTITFTPGATRAGITGLAVVETSPTSITWGWNAPEGTDTCEVEWDGPTRGTVEVGLGSQDLWRHTIGQLETGTTVALRVRSLGPNDVWDEWSDWVEGTAGVTGALAPPSNLRTERRYSTRVDLEWDMPSGLTLSQLQVRYGAETAYRSPIPVVQRAGRSRASIPADPGTNLAIQVRSAEDFDDGPYSVWFPDPAHTTSTLTGTQKPPTITDLTATGEIGHVALRWTQPDNVRRAHVQWTEQPEGGQRGPVRSVSIGDDGEHNVFAPRGTLIRARVRASLSQRLDSTGSTVGDWSDWEEATVIANIPVPTGLSATAGAGTVRWQWTLPPGIERSEIQWQINHRPDPLSGGEGSRRSVTRSPPEHTRQVPDGQYARARVRSVVADGHTSAWTPWTAYLQPTTRRDPGGGEDEIPSVPSLDVVTTINSLDVTIGIANGAASYEYSQLKADGTWTAPLSTPRAFTIEEDGDGDALEGGETYGLRVRARNRIGATQWVTGSFTTLIPVPEIPTVSATPGVTSVEFTVSEETYATRVEYQRETAAGAWPTAWSRAATNTFTVSSLTANTRYRFRFRACNSAGCSDARIEAFTTLSADTPTGHVPGRVPSVTVGGETAASLRVTYGAAHDATSHERRFKKATDTAWSSWSRVGGSGGGTFTLSGLDASTTYNVEVRGRNATGTGASRAASGTTEAEPVTCPTERPTASATSTASTAIVTFDTPARATRMQLRWRRSGGTYGSWSNVTSPHTLRSLSASTTYNVQVRGWNAACGTTGGGPVRTINVRTAAAPVLPVTEAPSVSWGSSASSLTFIIGAVANAARYQVNWSGSTVWTDINASRVHRVTGLPSGTSRMARFRGVNSAGQPGPASSFVTAWTDPGQATASLASSTTTSLSGTIAALTGATSYQYAHGASADVLGNFQTILGGGRSFTITGLTAGTTRYVRVRAVGSGGAGAASPTYSWTTAVVRVPPRPTNLHTYTGRTGSRNIDVILAGRVGAEPKAAQFQYQYANSNPPVPSAIRSAVSRGSSGSGSTRELQLRFNYGITTNPSLRSVRVKWRMRTTYSATAPYAWGPWTLVRNDTDGVDTANDPSVNDWTGGLTDSSPDP